MLSTGSGRFFKLIGIIVLVFIASYILGLILGGEATSFVFSVIVVVGSVIIWLLTEILSNIES